MSGWNGILPGGDTVSYYVHGFLGQYGASVSYKKERTDKEQLKEELREYANMLVEIESRFEQYNETDHQQEKRTAEVKQSL